MNITIECNKCKREFVLSTSLFGSLDDGDLHVDFLTCPFCRERYLFFSSDTEMRELVQRRQRIADQLKAGHAKHFKKKTLDGYMREMDRVKARQQEIYPALKERGKRLLEKHREVPDAEKQEGQS